MLDKQPKPDKYRQRPVTAVTEVTEASLFQILERGGRIHFPVPLRDLCFP
jgi:hypothetical protein